MLSVPPLPPYVVVLAVAGLLTALLTGVGVRFRDEIGADWFVATMGVTTAWIAGKIAALAVSDENLLVLLEICMSIASISVPVLWFTFVLEYTGRGDWLTRRTLGALWFVPGVAFALMLTSQWNELYWIVEWNLQTFDTNPGPWAWVTLAYLVGIFLTGYWLLLDTFRDHDRLFSGQAACLLLGTLAPLGVGLIQIFWFLPDDVPLITSSLSLLGLAYAWSLFNHRLFDILPATRRIGADESFDQLNEGVVIVNNGHDVVGINRSACRQFGCEKDDALGTSLSALSPELESALADGGTSDVVVDGSIFEVSTSVVSDSRDRPTGNALVVRDVTERRSRKQRLEVLNRVLRHNLRNDMTVVQGYAQEIDARTTGEISEMAAAIATTGEDLLGLAEKARAIERTVTTGDPDRRSLDVGETIARLVEEIREEYPDVAIDVERDGDLRVETEAPTLELVLRNVLENAVIHGTTSSSGTTHTSTVTVRAARTEGGVDVAVVDDGPGIPSTELSVIRRGTETALDHCSGLGLWLVSWGATRIGATLSFDTTDGTRVELGLPAE